MGGADIPITTSLRSLASMMDVFEAQLPTNAIDDYGTTPSDWVTVQIGGDVVYRGAEVCQRCASVWRQRVTAEGDDACRALFHRSTFGVSCEQS